MGRNIRKHFISIFLLSTWLIAFLAPLPAEIALLVLAECIRHPDFSFKQLADAVARRTNLLVCVPQIERLFEQHGLKKTTRTMAPKP